MLVGVRADHQVDVRAGPGRDAIDRSGGDDIAVDRRLPRHHAERHFGTPALRVGTRAEIGLQLGLGRQQSIERHGRDRLAASLDPKPLGKPLAELSGVDRDHVMGRAALGDRAPEQTGRTRHRQQRADAHRPG